MEELKKAILEAAAKITECAHKMGMHMDAAMESKKEDATDVNGENEPVKSMADLKKRAAKIK